MTACSIKHMSLACPRGLTPKPTVGIVREYKRMEYLPPGGEIQEIASEPMNWGGGIRYIVESWMDVKNIKLLVLRENCSVCHDTEKVSLQNPSKSDEGI